ncbi:hypothetical protein AB0N65_02890 [Paenarthrobacter sp. NPDC089322]|uniref:hypothetical protein n=1 Tax=Paenarthrobacter sp. NPDC089322 TaxID=3155065 RepID=UPI003413CB47
MPESFLPVVGLPVSVVGDRCRIGDDERESNLLTEAGQYEPGDADGGLLGSAA